MNGKEPHYDLAEVKRLIREGRYRTTRKSCSWLIAHGHYAEASCDMILSLESAEFFESSPPRSVDGAWADVYRCHYDEGGLRGVFYVKFIVDDTFGEVIVMSCKEWGYAW
ncbi:type II toxin-antitoxin system MqsR family toxin [Arabiibacter massiliensis]|uniref:type II toxin-antitoxin system MqsR family toxin n=1 Tax=Arabiibacter massiliensis TaxID=1870985 RepID=UPI0009BBA93F|nr:type II toxin-antitoxin system MqsR family toxin [Arabiibacter massiliensis]